jgi:hypothetical protein
MISFGVDMTCFIKDEITEDSFKMNADNRIMDWHLFILVNKIDEIYKYSFM